WMLLPGTASMIVPAGRPSIITLDVGRTLRTEGARPMLHCRVAVATAAGLPMSLVPLVVRAGAGRRGPRSVQAAVPRTEAVICSPVVVMKHLTDRSFPCSQPRAEGSR